MPEPQAHQGLPSSGPAPVTGHIPWPHPPKHHNFQAGMTTPLFAQAVPRTRAMEIPPFHLCYHFIPVSSSKHKAPWSPYSSLCRSTGRAPQLLQAINTCSRVLIHKNFIITLGSKTSDIHLKTVNIWLCSLKKKLDVYKSLIKTQTLMQKEDFCSVYQTRLPLVGLEGNM